jgi:CheY-like chemotaxis protein
MVPRWSFGLVCAFASPAKSTEPPVGSQKACGFSGGSDVGIDVASVRAGVAATVVLCRAFLDACCVDVLFFVFIWLAGFDFFFVCFRADARVFATGPSFVRWGRQLIVSGSRRWRRRSRCGQQDRLECVRIDYHRPMDPDPGLHIVASRLPLTGISVLVVDDNDDAREILRAVLEAEGALIATAASAAEAFDYLDHAIPNMMLVDISMPVVNGFELLELLRLRPFERGGRVPAAALTGYISGEDRARANAAGFAAYLVKPVDPHELIAVVKSLSRHV